MLPGENSSIVSTPTLPILKETVRMTEEDSRNSLSSLEWVEDCHQKEELMVKLYKEEWMDRQSLAVLLIPRRIG